MPSRHNTLVQFLFKTIVTALDGGDLEGSLNPISLVHHYLKADLPKEALRQVLPALRKLVDNYQNKDALKLAAKARELVASIHGSQPEAADIWFEVLCQQVRVLTQNV